MHSQLDHAPLRSARTLPGGQNDAYCSQDPAKADDQLGHFGKSRPMIRLYNWIRQRPRKKRCKMRRYSRHQPIVCLLLVITFSSISVTTSVRAGETRDISDAKAQVATKAGVTGMAMVDRDKIVGLLEAYGDARSRLMDEMLSLLAISDPSDIRDAWANRADKGKDLLERLDRDVPIGPSGEGLAGAGIADFANGERKIWELNAKADLASTAEIMAKITAADKMLIKRCEEDLKTVRDQDKVIEEQLAISENDILDGITDFVKQASKMIATKQLTGDLKDGSAKAIASAFISRGMKRLDENYVSAKDKHRIMGILVEDINFIEKTKDKLSVNWIDEVYKKGQEFAGNLPSAGASGDYKAEDWQKFQETAMRSLEEAFTQSIESSKKVFEDILPVFKAEIKSKFSYVMDEGDKLNSWRAAVDDQFRTMDDLFAKQDEYDKAMSTGPFRTAVEESFADLESTFKTYWQLFRSRSKDADDEMKR
jgi:hypothetical protein